MTRVTIIGGSDAGVSAALRAREVNPDVCASLEQKSAGHMKKTDHLPL